MFGHVV